MDATGYTDLEMSAFELGHSFEQYLRSGWSRFSGPLKSYSISLVGGIARSIRSEDGITNYAEIVFLSSEGVEQVHYTSLRDVWSDARLYTHDEYGNIPVGGLIEPVLEMVFDLNSLTINAYHCRDRSGQTEGRHTYPLLKEFGGLMRGFMEPDPQLKRLLDYVEDRIPKSQMPQDFDRETWSVELQLTAMPTLPSYCEPP